MHRNLGGLMLVLLAGNAYAGDKFDADLAQMSTPAGYAQVCGALRDDNEEFERMVADDKARKELLYLSAYCINSLLAVAETAQSYGKAPLVGSEATVCIPKGGFQLDALMNRTIEIEVERRRQLKDEGASVNDVALLALADLYPCSSQKK